nr:serine protease [Pacificimonas pallii]
MVSPRLFLTNNHVLTSEAHAEHSLIEFGYLTSIGGLREAYPFRLAPDEFFVTDEELDFTLVAVQPMNDASAALQSRGHCPMIPATGKAVAGQRVNIIQHPRGERMQVSMRGNRIVDIPGNFLHYETDTEPGSSGSPVFNDQWEMAALHHAGVPARDGNGKIKLKSGGTWRSRRDNDDIEWVANEGVRISRIVEHLKGLDLASPQRRLFEQTQRPPEPMDLWDLIEGRSSPLSNGGMQMEAGGIASNLGAGISGPHIGPDGSPSWLFRLNFGPVSK